MCVGLLLDFYSCETSPPKCLTLTLTLTVTVLPKTKITVVSLLLSFFLHFSVHNFGPLLIHGVRHPLFRIFPQDPVRTWAIIWTGSQDTQNRLSLDDGWSGRSWHVSHRHMLNFNWTLIYVFMESCLGGMVVLQSRHLGNRFHCYIPLQQPAEKRSAEWNDSVPSERWPVCSNTKFRAKSPSLLILLNLELIFAALWRIPVLS